MNMDLKLIIKNKIEIINDIDFKRDFLRKT